MRASKPRNNIMRTIQQLPRQIALAVGLATATAAMSQALTTRQADALRATITANSQGKVPIDAITSTPVPGLYQVTSDGEIFYVDATGRYTFVGGSMVDMQTRQDLTANELDRLHAIPFDRLPLQYALKEVKGNGARKMALFEDPNCPNCRVFTKFVDQLEDVTIYRFMYPVIAPASEVLARAAWCSQDPGAAWHNIMNGARPQAMGTTCDASGLAEILKFGERHRINNTPTVVLASGKRLVGATPPEQFMQELELGGRPAK
jgi:thiol:disulfide interchange protein DsbC